MICNEVDPRLYSIVYAATRARCIFNAASPRIPGFVSIVFVLWQFCVILYMHELFELWRALALSWKHQILHVGRKKL
jgi:hypothetical protein